MPYSPDATLNGNSQSSKILRRSIMSIHNPRYAGRNQTSVAAMGGKEETSI